MVPLRACLKTEWGPAARNFGGGRGGEIRASPQRAVRIEPTKATGKRPAARRVFAEKAGWLRCSSVTGPAGLLPRRAARLSSPKSSPSGLCRENRAPLSFQTGSKRDHRRTASVS